MDNYVITIARACGSGGSFVGQALSKKLGIAYYDRNLLRIVSDESGISQEMFEKADEKVKNSLVYKVSKKVYNGELIPPESGNFTSDRNLFNYQAKVLRELAKNQSYVVIGRCADFVLSDTQFHVNVFIGGSHDICVARESEVYGLSIEDARAQVDKLNRERAAYARYFTGRDFSDASNYGICLSTDNLSYEQCADLIIEFMKKKYGDKIDL